MGCCSSTSASKKERYADPNKPEEKHAEDKSAASPAKEGFSVGPDIFVSLKKGQLTQTYSVGKTLGEGAYGKVNLVTHKQLGLIRAMKSLKKNAVLKDEAEKLFAEVNILRDMDHPHIVKLFELFQDDNHYYLITEFCSGGELFDKIKTMRNFSEKLAAEYMKQILSSIVYCHDKKIVHRDLKPENLLLENNKQDSMLKIIDFGTSKKFAKGKKMTEKLGTPYYIAPEVLSGSYDEKCDIWSCGVILYILLCGYPPFTGYDDGEILRKVKKGDYTFDDEEWKDVSNEAKTLIKKMLTMKPQDRISAKDCIADPWIQKNVKTQ